MTPYAYRAVGPGGQIVRGRLGARDLPDLERRLARLGLELLRGKPAIALQLPGRPAIPRRELINFCFHLEQFLQAGVPILDSLAHLRDSLEHPYTQNPPNNGTLVEVGGLGINAEAASGFDIGGTSGKAWAVLTVGSATKLYSINLTSGMATAIGDLPAGTHSLAVGLGF